MQVYVVKQKDLYKCAWLLLLIYAVSLFPHQEQNSFCLLVSSVQFLKLLKKMFSNGREW